MSSSEIKKRLDIVEEQMRNAIKRRNKVSMIDLNI
jgi:hypothetical protein